MIYLDNAATSWPKPEEVYTAMDDFLRRLGANPGRGGFRMAAEAEMVITGARKLIKDLLGVPPEGSVVFTLNCTDALNMALKGLLRPGDHVVTSRLEHNSVSRPLHRLREQGVEFSQVGHDGEGYIDPGEIKKLLRPRTKMIVLTHASNVLGTLEPVEEVGRLARESGVIFLLDAAQTAGAVPIHMQQMQVDLLAAPGHKALFGPPGSGVLAVGDKRLKIASLREGGTGSDSEAPYQPVYYPDRLEAGTPNTVGIAGLKAGVEFLLREGPEKIRAHETALLKRLLEGLTSIPGVTVYGPCQAAHRAGLVSFNLRDWDPRDAAAALESGFEIACRAGLHCAPWTHLALGTHPDGALRFSPGYFTSTEEIDLAVQAVAALAETV